MTIIGLSSFPSSRAFRDDPESALEAGRDAFKIEGRLGAFFGMDVESNVGYLLVEWESADSLRALRSDKAALQKLKDAVSICMEENHVQEPAKLIDFVSDYNQAFSAPVTEISFAHLKEPDGKAALVELLSTMTDQMQGNLTWGPVLDQPQEFALACGWPSVEGHYEFIKAPGAAEMVAKYFQLVDATVKHVKLTKANA